MSKLGDILSGMNAKIDALISARSGNGNTVPNGSAAPVNGAPLDDSRTAALLQAFIKGLQDEGFLPEKPLYKRGVGNGTPDETPASVNGPVTVLYGLRKLKEKITAANFVIGKLPRFSAVAGVAGQRINGNAARNSWNARDVDTVKRRYEELSEVVKELKSLMSPLTLNI